MVTEYDKDFGTRSIMFEIKRKKEIAFSEGEMLEGTGFSRFNVWTQYQIDVEG